jgi:phage-related protein
VAGSLRVLRYLSRGGADPVGKYLDDLPAREAGAVAGALQAIESFGLSASGVTTRQLRGRLWELKVGAHRVFFVAMAGGTMVLLHAYRKGSQRAPRHEIETALARMKDVVEHER